MIKIIKIFLLVLLFAVVAEPHPSWGLVMDRNGNLYFADISHNGGSVWKLTAAGELKLLLRNFHAHNVSLDNDQNLITAHGEGNHTMVRIHPNGKIDTLYHTNNYLEFFGGNCTWSQNGNIIYGLREHKYLRAIDKNGNQKNIGDYQFTWNQTVYAASDGTIYATEIGVGNGCIIKIDPSGNSEVIARNLISSLNRPKDIHNDILLGIKKDNNGFVYVAETAGKRIIKILSNGQTETFYKSEENWLPTAIEFNSGNSYIPEYKSKNGNDGPRIIKLDKSGKKKIIFDYSNYTKE